MLRRHVLKLLAAVPFLRVAHEPKDSFVFLDLGQSLAVSLPEIDFGPSIGEFTFTVEYDELYVHDKLPIEITRRLTVEDVKRGGFL